MVTKTIFYKNLKIISRIAQYFRVISFPFFSLINKKNIKTVFLDIDIS